MSGIGTSAASIRIGSQGFCVAPRKHTFAAHTILELPLALDHQHLCAVLRHVFGESGTAQSAACDDQIIGNRPAFILLTGISIQAGLPGVDWEHFRRA
jgi:hypothetical protein